MTTAQFFEKFDLFAGAPDAVAKMRSLILELAVCGGLSRGGHNGWQELTVGSLCQEITPGFACSRSHQKPDGHVHLRTHNVSTLGTLNFDLLVRIDPKQVDKKKSSLRAGDVLFNNTNSQDLVGKTCLVDRDYDYAFSNHITRLRFKAEVEPGYVVLYLTSLRNSGYFSKLCTRWINQAAINTETLKKQLVPLPPLDEQKRIVAKVDELMALCDQLETQRQERETKHTALARATLARFTEAPTPTNLNLLFHSSFSIQPSDLRKTILTLAVQGKLVPQDPNEEPAEEILRRVVAACPEETQVPVSDAELPWTLPVSWRWVRIAEVATIKHGYAFSSRSFTSDPTPYVLTTPGNFYESGGFRDRGANTKYFRGQIPPAFVLNPGDLIIPMTEQAAGLLGSPAFIPNDGKTYLHNQRLGKLEFHSTDISPEFVFWFFNNGFFRGELARTCTGMKVRHTSPKRILKVPFPLPPLAEQKRIVAKVEELMALVDALEAQQAAADQAATHLLDAVVSELAAAA